jgi:DNA ligase-1
MKSFSGLLEGLLYAPGRNAKLSWLQDWLAETPDPDRGWGLAALTGELTFAHVKAGLVRELAAAASDPELFALSYDFVGDLAETTALIWPEPAELAPPPRLAAIVEALQQANRQQAAELISGWLGSMDATQRWALLKLATGGLRVGVSGRLARLSVATAFDRDIAEIEEIWPLLEPPYRALFDWLEGRADRPDARGRAVFRPLMLAHPLSEEAAEQLDMTRYQTEWKWDGARVELAAAEDGVRLFSRSGDDITAAFPEIVPPAGWQGTLDGELLAGQPDAVASFGRLQQRLNRKKAGRKLQADNPVFLRVYDLLIEGETDWREKPLSARRARLEQLAGSWLPDGRLDLSEVLAVATPQELDELRAACRSDQLIEGMMLKLKDSPYLAGRPKGHWWKWKRDPLRADLVIMYAQRGHGRRSSLYSDFTLGAWRDGADGPELVPVAKAYSGFSDQELRALDKFVRQNIVNRFGPVREVEKQLVAELAFDSVQRSSRHRSGVALRFPRFHAVRWDKPAEEADWLPTIEALIGD